ncbi:MAG: hypothetical protein M3125_09180, partial [Gemmatimonadota bacterium]|nr:hypothetical protein [Gemmatimonadota bacterium]
MRWTWLIIPAAVVIGCTDRTVSTAPESDVPVELPPNANLTAANVPTPVDGDRILIDTRTTLQQARNEPQAIDAFGRQARVAWLWAFTGNIDGQGTNALRIDWPKRPRSRCSYATTTLTIPLPAPVANRIVVQSRRRLGRTATGGGFGSIGEYSLTDHECPDGRPVESLRGESVNDASIDVDYAWTGVAPIA